LESSITKDLTKNSIQDAAYESAANNISKEAKEQSIHKVESIKQTVDQTNEEIHHIVNKLKQKYGDEAVEKFIPFCEKYGINPYDVLTRPPAEGQSLIGWGLGIDNIDNPVNHQVMKLNFTKEEINNILEKSIKNKDSKVVVLGYGNGVSKPYFALGDEIDGSYLSLSAEDWAPFENALANFWTDINEPFINSAIEQRKIFIFNINVNEITDVANSRRFSLPELKLIEMEKNNYFHAAYGEYSVLAPQEIASSLDEFLPASILRGE
jgi:hypothetical protein